ncbi:MAG: ribose-5-phosphate isomerase RpiA [Bacteroidota bacterium]
MSTTPQDDAKRAAGEQAARLAENGMRLGLGTGSTTAYALQALGRRVAEEGLQIEGVPTSFAAERLARQVGLPLTTLDQDTHLHLAFDGADEVDPHLHLTKGRGAAQAREKVVAAQADRFVVLADDSKLVERLGTRMPLPVEVLPMAVGPVRDALERAGGRVDLRMGQRKDGPVITDQGLWVLDVHFEGGIVDPEGLNAHLNALPGVLDHGLFIGLAHQVIIGEIGGGVRTMQRG